MTNYFRATRQRRDRAAIEDEWIRYTIEHPEYERLQVDGRIRRWAKIEAMEGGYLRVVLLPDGETLQNAFFDRGFKP